MLFNKLVRISVGTDVSRPLGVSIADEDVIHRSLHSTYPEYFVKAHHYTPMCEWWQERNDAV